ncbi:MULTISPECIES: CBASS system CD-NTase/cGAS isopeptidase Cap3 [Pseudoalteromonas]|jgi:integrative and conjugative element protein (TIGR02256 family)|uniref:CBASS system CD-NTase/cGAS isopeptidase Cap3 n=1 Tax=Pseudoalteromonas TaxID=53246 RepID=UPI0015FBBF95|nr:MULTISPECIES: Mov34/MPN/PAD-1 family protein [unclassified Pseudoalteromonas]MBB1378082.1 Mov34/MPN/PAD-1 family protein [Pseudoalteromonas sp. SR43-2]MBH0003754.1 Mov34/MPN/PAD-1 family protein [Pseudoalteromonas sp. SWYJZ12]|tara:strand:- start:108 stop:608 length:501 start_codon:yes stop_codon:yes gene_type:complete
MKTVCELVFEDEVGNTVVILEHVFNTMLDYRQLTPTSLEAAGVLVGERRGSHLIICDLSVPNTGDIRSRYRVDRKGKHHQSKVIECFYSSNGFQQYIGEWHTHPEDHPSPSFLDKQSWKENLVADVPMLAIILGRKALWIARKEGNKIREMREVDLSSNIKQLLPK